VHGCWAASPAWAHGSRQQHASKRCLLSCPSLFATCAGLEAARRHQYHEGAPRRRRTRALGHAPVMPAPARAREISRGQGRAARGDQGQGEPGRAATSCRSAHPSYAPGPSRHASHPCPRCLPFCRFRFSHPAPKTAKGMSMAWTSPFLPFYFGLQSKQSGRLFQRRTEWFIHRLVPPKKVLGFISSKRIPSNWFYHFRPKIKVECNSSFHPVYLDL
jgi:hypothetical protein